jgi:CBS domain-containing protein
MGPAENGSHERGPAMKCIKAIIGNRETVTVERSMSVGDVARMMAERQIGAVPVVEGDRLVGVFSERDVLTRVVAAGRSAEATPVGDVMSSGLVVAEAGERYETCLNRMQQAHVRHLIVLDKIPGGRLAGILSLRDLLAADIDEKDEAIGLLNAYVHYIPADLDVRLKT